ncbi:hypothetical protein BDV30DRAFT_157043 [Aspergillus minisclerotigenes]|uniref:Uncharacterized protein n=1 Tax=Aspergillus minisclerotigenes TaxID=656917 RepID=A0A5N6JIR5_9EURO|nr:hypothetical protein BDV30DRAFT_157043 [Aspergillus minisclerotigenes]
MADRIGIEWFYHDMNRRLAGQQKSGFSHLYTIWRGLLLCPIFFFYSLYSLASLFFDVCFKSIAWLFWISL